MQAAILVTDGTVSLIYRKVRIDAECDLSRALPWWSNSKGRMIPPLEAP
jgi:hypothetical protein